MPVIIFFISYYNESAKKTKLFGLVFSLSDNKSKESTKSSKKTIKFASFSQLGKVGKEKRMFPYCAG